MVKFLNSWQITGLQPPRLYEAGVLNFGTVNYFIGKNGAGKTQVLRKVHEQIRSTLNPSDPQQHNVAKFLPAVRIHTVVGNREMRGERLEQFETENPTAEAFFQFLNENEFTKAMVQSQLNAFFEKSLQITPQGRNILMEIFEKWETKEEEIVEQIEKAVTKPEAERKRFNLSSESDGMKEFLILLTYIYHPRVKFIIVDEPELHLHPHMINFVLDAIEEAAANKEKQFFIVAHSPTVVRLVPSKDWKYFFFLKEKNKVVCFDKFSEPNFAQLIPHLNPFRREAFYSEKIILVEGEADYQILHGIAKRIGYSETSAGGFTFFPSWGAYELENLYNFFKALRKDIRIIVDNNIDRVGRDRFDEDFKTNILGNSDITKKLSVNDITGLCLKKKELYSEKSKLSDKTKRRVVREELKLIYSDDFNPSNYQELINIIKEILGEAGYYPIPEELVEMTQRLISEFQLNFSKEPFLSLIKSRDIEGLKKSIAEDVRLNSYWQDTDQDAFILKTNIEEGWECQLVFRVGKNRITVGFNSKTDHTKFQPKVVSS